MEEEAKNKRSSLSLLSSRWQKRKDVSVFFISAENSLRQIVAGSINNAKASGNALLIIALKATG